MKKSLFSIVLITAFVLFALSMTGCDNGTTTEPTTYTVTFNANGGTPTPETQTIEEGKKATEPTGVTKGTDTLDGWYKEANFTTKWNFATDTVTANITLYAKWNINQTDTECDCPNGTVHTDAECGCNADDCTCTYEPATQNQAPTANAGTDFEHNITTSGTTITLNGSGTDTDGTIEGYAWTCTDKPNGSTAPTFSNSAIANPTVSGFDMLGDYEFSLKVKDNDNKESTADVVKVSLVRTATKNITASFPALSLPGATIDFTPTYTPTIAGGGFEDSDVEYTLTDEDGNTWNKTTGYVVNVSSYVPNEPIFTLTYKYKDGTVISTSSVKGITSSFGGGRFSAIHNVDTNETLSAIPPIDITLSKKVSAGAIPVLPEYETVTAMVTAEEVTITFPTASLPLVSDYSFDAVSEHFSNTDLESITYTLSADGITEATFNASISNNVLDKVMAFGDSTSSTIITQTFYWNNGVIGSRKFQMRLNEEEFTRIYAVNADNTIGSRIDVIPETTLTLSKQVEKE